MVKKKFSQGINAILGGATTPTATVEETPQDLPPPPQKPASKPILETKVATKKVDSPQTKVTLRIDSALLDTVKAVAYWERKTMTEVFSEALRAHLQILGEEYIESAISAHKQ